MLATSRVLLVVWLVAVVASEATEPAEPAAKDDLASRVDSLTARVDALQAQLQALQDAPSQRRCFSSPPPRSISAPPPAFIPLDPKAPVNTSLHEAAARDDVDALVALLRRGATLEERDARGDTALHAAARQGAARATNELLRRGADPRTRGALLRTPLHAAAAHGQLESARRLVEAGAPLGARDARGATALALAARHNNRSDLFEWLLQREPSVEWADAAGDSALLAAARAGEWARAKKLAGGGAAPAARGRDGVSALLLAAGAGQEGALAALEAMLRRGALCDAREVARALAAAAGGPQVWAIAQAAPEQVVGAAGQEALRQAARDGRVEALAALLAAGVDPALPGADGRTALQLAARAGHVACVHALLLPLANRTDLILRALYDADSAMMLNALDEEVPHVLRGPALDVISKQTVRDGRCDIALALMALEPQQDQLDAAILLSQPGANATCVEPLLKSVFSVENKTEIVKKILKLSKNSDIFVALAKTVPSVFLSVAGVNSLSEAVQGGRCHMVRALLAAGVGAGTDDAQKVLEAAVESAEVECVRALRSGGVAPLAGERWERELLVTAKEGKWHSLVALLAAGVRIDAKDGDGKTPLILASEQGHLDIVRELLKVNANVNISDDIGETALILSSQHGHVQVVRLLLAANAKVNAINVLGRTALFYAAFYGHTNAVRELLKANANVNISDTIGYTALIMSARYGYLEIVRLLLAANADVNARNFQGKTALDNASEYNHDLVKQELLKFKNV